MTGRARAGRALLAASLAFVLLNGCATAAVRSPRGRAWVTLNFAYTLAPDGRALHVREVVVGRQPIHTVVPLPEEGEEVVESFGRWAVRTTSGAVYAGEEDAPRDFVRVPFPGAASDLAWVGSRLCALMRGGGVHCWDDVHERVEPLRGAPSDLTELDGGASLCGLDRSGGLYCWEWDGTQLSGDARRVERDVESFTGFNSGYLRTCFVRHGALRCWGQDREAAERSAPPILRGVTSVAGGAGFGCAVADEVLYCWGRGSYWILDGEHGFDGATIPEWESQVQLSEPRAVHRVGPGAHVYGMGMLMCVESPDLGARCTLAVGATDLVRQGLATRLPLGTRPWPGAAAFDPHPPP